MKKFMISLVWICIIGISLTGCEKKDIGSVGEILLEDSQQEQSFSHTGGQVQLVFTANKPWVLSVPADAEEWCEVDQTQGDAGHFDLAVEVKSNLTDHERTAMLVLTAGNTRKDILIKQAKDHVLTIENKYMVVPVEGGDIKIHVTSNIDYNIHIERMYQDWIEQVDSPVSSDPRAPKTDVLQFRIGEYTGEERREGKITFSNNRVFVDVIIAQGKEYESTDYSLDGLVTTHSQATEGSGINVVFMGDAFSDRQIAEGLYDRVMTRAIDAFFADQPYRSFRQMFNIYSVNIVSRNEGYFKGGRTALSGYFGDGTLVGGADSVALRYAQMAPTVNEQNEDATLIIVMMNRDYYAGTCYMHFPRNRGDIGMGLAVAYFPLGTDDAMFNGLVSHEAGGHGFAKLGDEYSYLSNGPIPRGEEQRIKNYQSNYGWYKNADFTNDSAVVTWRRFITDSRYASERIGVYEGGCTYPTGVYRPTRTSIMVRNEGGFNAPSREAIYYRIHKLAYGDSWQFDYEKFVAFDMQNQNERIARTTRLGVFRDLEPLHPPIACERLTKF